MSDSQFADFIVGCRNELARLQPQFQERIRDGGPWSYDLSDGTLCVGSHSFPISPIGTYSSEHHSWLWAWANEEFPLRARDASRNLQKLRTLTGFQVFASPGISASDQDAQDFVAMAVHSLDAIGVFRVPGNPTLLLAVHEPSDFNASSA